MHCRARSVGFIWWIVPLSLFCLLICGPAFADKRVALVIGNSSYQHVTRLANPTNDAKLMARTLVDLGFTLVGDGALVDLDEAKLRSAVQSFGAKLRGADVGLLYYSGHGVQVRGENYLVPVDANPTTEADVDFQMVNTNLALRQMESAGTKLNLVILDACRNNPFGGRGLRGTDAGLAQMRAPEGTLISFATQPGNVALDGTGEDSPFTKALAQTIRRAGLDIFQTFNDVGLAVMQETGGAQQPWVSTSPIGGSFFFAGAGNAGPSVQPGLDPAAQAWAATANTTSLAVLQDFVRQYGDTTFGSMARARMAELTKNQSSAPDAESSGRSPAVEPRFVFNEAAVRRLAEKQKVPLPSQLAVNFPSHTTPDRLMAYLGAWGADQGWNGKGRNTIVVIEEIDDSGVATGIVANGPPTPSSPNKAVAAYTGFTSPVTADGISLDKGQLHFKFKVAGNLMLGDSQGKIGPRDVHFRITLERIGAEPRLAKPGSN